MHWFRSRYCFLWKIYINGNWHEVRKSWTIQGGFRTRYVSMSLRLSQWA
jgi:hypothetical protein